MFLQRWLDFDCSKFIQFKFLSNNLEYLEDEDILEKYDAIMKYISQIWFGLDFEIPSYELGYLCWDGYPLYFLPSNFDGDNPTNELQSVAT